MAEEPNKKAEVLEPPYVEFSPSECKGCQLCADACPKKCIVMSEGLNERSYHPATYTGEGCTGCGVCFYACPEPGAIKVYKKKVDKLEKREEKETGAATGEVR